MAETTFNFEHIRGEIVECINSALKTQDVTNLIDCGKQHLEAAKSTYEVDVKTVIDTSFKDILLEFIRLKVRTKRIEQQLMIESFNSNLIVIMNSMRHC